jgi:hypothetical protein
MDSSKTASAERENVSHLEDTIIKRFETERTRYRYLLAVEYVIVPPDFTDTKALVESSVLVGLCEKPRRVHEIFPWMAG